MLFTLLDRFRSRIQRHKASKASNKVPQPHMQRHSQDSNDSEYTHLSIDTTSSLSASTSVESLLSVPTGSDFLWTNDQPSPQQSVEIHALIQLKAQRLLEMERRKRDLDRQRELLDRQRQLLDEEVGDMTDEIDQYRRAVGCGMRNMPPELLSEIFQHYVVDASCSLSIGSATTLTHVCRAWRRCALSLPTLWTSLSAQCITKHTVGNVLRRLDQAKAATGLPLKLAFNFQRTDNPEFEQRCSDLMFASAAHIHRWESFTLECEDESLASEVFPAISETTIASRLETLRLVGSPAPWSTSLIHASPTLRNLQLKLSTDSARVLSTLSLPHLESLDIEIPTLTPSALLALLKDAPSLKVCKIRVGAIVDLDDDPLDMVVHSSLETFELRVSRGASGDTTAQLLENLSLPSAHEVLLEIGHLPNDTITHDDHLLPDDLDLDLSWPHDSFFGFLERASSSITSLCVGFNPTPVDSPDTALMMGGMGMGAELEEDHVRAYLDLDNVGKSLVSLHVRRDKPVWPELLEYLTLPNSSSSLSRRPSTSASLRSAKSRSSLHSSRSDSLRLPQLRNVALDIDPIFQVLAMRKFVKSRWYDNGDETHRHNFSRLRSFIVTLCFPDIPNLELESAAVKTVFERISRGSAKSDFDVVFRKRTYAMMPMDVPRLPIRDELVI